MQFSTAYLQKRGLAEVQKRGSALIIGVDEVGYGCIAGPVMVGAAVTPANWADKRVRDSKKVDATRRARLVREVLVPPTVAFSIVLSHPSNVIDQMGVSVAKKDLMLQVISVCRARFPGALVVLDGNDPPLELSRDPNVVCFPKADDLVKAVSAASILAKEDRDECMRFLHQEFPGYGFKTHVGYGTPEHISALARRGPCPIHRFSYRNVQEVARKFGYTPPGSSKPSPEKNPPAKISGWRRPPKGMHVSTSSSRP